MLIILISSYFLGSIPFGLIVARAYGIDITITGSGNTGATNVFRTLGKVAGFLVFALDLLKGAMPVFLAKVLSGDPLFVIFCGIAAISGHMFSPFLRFKGGKGVATGLGVILGIAPYLFILSFSLGALIIAVSGYVSVASITGSVLLTILAFRTGQPLPYAWGIFLMTVFIICKHIPNIKRLLEGKENKISWKVQEK